MDKHEFEDYIRGLWYERYFPLRCKGTDAGWLVMLPQWPFVTQWVVKHCEEQGIDCPSERFDRAKMYAEHHTDSAHGRMAHRDVMNALEAKWKEWPYGVE